MHFGAFNCQGWSQNLLAILPFQRPCGEKFPRLQDPNRTSVIREILRPDRELSALCGARRFGHILVKIITLISFF